MNHPVDKIKRYYYFTTSKFKFVLAIQKVKDPQFEPRAILLKFWNLINTCGLFTFVVLGQHLTHICERWAQDRTDGLQYAYFNGAGYESWENIWGIWNGFTPRDGSALKRVSTILRKFGYLIMDKDTQWTPHIPVVYLPLNSKTFVSEFR